MGKKLVAALLLLAWTSLAQAAGPRAAIDAMEASMLVTGTIEVDPAGNVERFELDERAKLPESVERLLVQAVPRWRFEPTLVDGAPAAVRTTMRIRVAANRVPGDADSFTIRVAGASYGEAGEGDLKSASLQPPTYPSEPLQRGVQGTVYLLVKVGRAGAVEDVVAEQVNLQLVAGERIMRRMRAALERAAVHAARTWTFIPPTAPEEVDAPFWTARVPVDFRLRGVQEPGYGEWSPYVPGPRTLPPWEMEDTSVGADSFASNEIYTVGKGLKLLTPIGG